MRRTALEPNELQLTCRNSLTIRGKSEQTGSRQGSRACSTFTLVMAGRARVLRRGISLPTVALNRRFLDDFPLARDARLESLP